MWRVYLRKMDSELFVEIGVFRKEESVEKLFSIYAENFGVKERDSSGTVKRLLCLSYCELVALKENRGKRSVKRNERWETRSNGVKIGVGSVEDEEKAIVDAAAALEELLKDENATKEQIDEKVKDLTEKSHKLAEAMYKKEQGGCADGSCGTDAKKKKDDDDVIDAEVE